MDDIIDNALEAEAPVAVETEAVESEQADSQETAEEKRLTEAEWLKKERNVVSRRDKQIGKLRAQYEATQAELAKYRQQEQPQVAPQAELKEPQEGDFKSYHEYIRALEKFDRAKDLKELETRLSAKDTSSVREYQQRQWETQRDMELDKAGEEYAKLVPNFMDMVAQNATVIQNFPDAIKRVIKEIDAQDVVKAFHAMVENDTLEDLGDMTPVQAAAAIVRAASMPPKIQNVSRAPAPLTQARGTGTGQKTLNRMSPEELVQWVNS